MADDDQQPVTYLPDSGEPAPPEAAGEGEERKGAIKDQRRADDLAEKLASADELSGYEKVAGRGLPPSE